MATVGLLVLPSCSSVENCTASPCMHCITRGLHGCAGQCVAMTVSPWHVCCRFSWCSRLPFVCRLVDEIVWVKMTVNRRLAKSHGFYLQHAKEASGL